MTLSKLLHRSRICIIISNGIFDLNSRICCPLMRIEDRGVFAGRRSLMVREGKFLIYISLN